MKNRMIFVLFIMIIFNMLQNQVKAQGIFVTPNPVPAGGNVLIDAPPGASCTINGEPIFLNSNGDSSYSVSQPAGSTLLIVCEPGGSVSIRVVENVPNPPPSTSFPGNTLSPTSSPTSTPIGCPDDLGSDVTLGCIPNFFEEPLTYYNCLDVGIRIRSRPIIESTTFVGVIEINDHITIIGDVVIPTNGTGFVWFITDENQFVVGGLLSQDSCLVNENPITILSEDCDIELEQIYEFFIFGLSISESCDAITNALQPPLNIVSTETQSDIHEDIIVCDGDNFSINVLVLLDIMDTLAQISLEHVDFLQNEYNSIPNGMRCDFIEDLLIHHTFEELYTRQYDAINYISSTLILSCEPTMSANLVVDLSYRLIEDLQISDFNDWRNFSDILCDKVVENAMDLLTNDLIGYNWELGEGIQAVLLTEDQNGHREIFALSSSGIVSLVQDDSIHTVSVSSTGNSIIYTSEDSIYLLETNGSDSSQIFQLPEDIVIPDENLRSVWDNVNDIFYTTGFNGQRYDLYRIVNVSQDMDSTNFERIELYGDILSLRNPDYLANDNSALIFESIDRDTTRIGRILSGIDTNSDIPYSTAPLMCNYPVSSELLEFYVLCTIDGDIFRLYKYNAFDDAPLNQAHLFNSSCVLEGETISFIFLTRGPIDDSFFLIDTHGTTYLSTVNDQGQRLTSCLPFPENRRILAIQWAGG